MLNIYWTGIFLAMMLALGAVFGGPVNIYCPEVVQDFLCFENYTINDVHSSYEIDFLMLETTFQSEESSRIQLIAFWLDPVLIFFPNFAIVSKFFIPFSRFSFLIFKAVDRKNILENKRRLEIYTLIKENPGMYFSEISRETNLKKGTAEYHLKMMESEGIIAPFSESGRLCYFIANSRYSNEEKKLILVLRDETLKKIITEIYKNPKINNKKIAEAIGYSESTASKHLKSLKNHGIIESRTKGWYTMYDISTEFYVLLEKHIYSEPREK